MTLPAALLSITLTTACGSAASTHRQTLPEATTTHFAAQPRFSPSDFVQLDDSRAWNAAVQAARAQHPLAALDPDTNTLQTHWTVSPRRAPS